jgi:hypothetical protein
MEPWVAHEHLSHGCNGSEYFVVFSAYFKSDSYSVFREGMILENSKQGFMTSTAGAHQFLSCGERCRQILRIISTFF